MKVITFLNEKGGVGKTTLATTIAAGLAIRGAQVLLIDADAQGNATEMFGFEAYSGYYNLIERDAPFAEVVRTVMPERVVVPDEATNLKGSLRLVGSNHETRHVMSGGSHENPHFLRHRLEQLEGLIDVVIIDTSPTPSMMHLAIYLATHALVFPTQLQVMSIQGLFRSVRNVQNFNPFRAGLGLGAIETLGVVPTQTELRAVEHAENYSLLVEQFGEQVLWRPMAKRILWQEASAARRSIFSFAPDSDAAVYGHYMVDQVLQYVSA